LAGAGVLNEAAPAPEAGTALESDFRSAAGDSLKNAAAKSTDSIARDQETGIRGCENIGWIS
jgi:hypothetical protein